MSTTLLRGATVFTENQTPVTAVAVQDDQVVFVGNDDQAAEYDGADSVLDLGGALVAPAFVDAHVHTVASGFLLTQLDLRFAESLNDALDLLAAYAGERALVVGSGWDETRWPERRPPTSAELDRATRGARVFLDRVDGHSSVLSSAMVEAVPGLPGIDGYDASGRVERHARHAVSATLAGLVGPDERLSAARRAVAAMAAVGVAGFHENAAPHIGPAYELDLVRQAASEAGLLVTCYWGEALDPDAAQRLGVAGLAGDLNADGAIGSRTAALRQEYADRPGHLGNAYLEVAQIADHVERCTRAGIQAGFHCIGDAGLDAATAGFRLAEQRLGRPALAAAGHRLEHVEMPSSETIAMMADLQVTASMQPRFDALWGGPAQMYAARLGERWRGMNPFAELVRAGVPLAFGSDSPVTEVSPWSALRAAVRHHEESQRLDPVTAFGAHTRGGWRAARQDGGVLVAGAPAHLAVWDCPGGLAVDGLPNLEEDEPPRLQRLLVAGRTVLEEGT